VFDLIVVARPAKTATAAETVLEDALFESGRPVLMAPPRVPATLGGGVVVIAWNGSTETAVAVAHARPFLIGAKEVQVISVETGVVPGAPPGDELARNLRYHGIPAHARHVATKVAAGGVWLEECRAVKADLLVKGAYTMSRLRQMVFGGPTRQITLEAELPVLLAR